MRQDQLGWNVQEAELNGENKQEVLERALQEATAFLKDAQVMQDFADEIMGVGTWYFEYDEEGNISNCFWSKSFRRMLGFAEEDDFSNTVEEWSGRVHPDDREYALQLYRDCMNGRGDYDLEYRMLKKDNTYAWYHDVAHVLRYGNGKPRLFMGTITDVTKDRENRHLQSIIGSVVSIYFGAFAIRLADDYIQELSSHPIRPENYPKGNYSAKYAMDFIVEKCIVSEVERERVRRFLDLSTINERLRGEKSLTVEFNSTFKNWISATIIPVSRDADGNVLEYVLAFKEISKEKEAELRVKQALEDAYEAANRASAAKSNFLSNMSHDIRTPMNAIIGMTAIACTHIDDKERVMDCLNKITVSSKHLLGLINEILDMSKIESGKLDLHMEEFDLSKLVDNLITMTRPQIEAHRHQLIVNIREIEHEAVVGDSQRIQQAFVNLMSNAVKYTPNGGTIRLSITEKPTNQRMTGCYEFVFEDNGIGMSKEFLEHLFDPFARAEDSRVSKTQGAGLGMAITRNIVHMMNGEIEVKSEPGKGSRFTVTIYLELQDVQEDASNEILADLPVLVADDDQVSCECACELLTDLGMVSEWVLTGEEAVERVGERHDRADDFFAVILDWKMPGMDGLATAKAIRAKVGDEVPIIIISAYDWSDIEQEARQYGVNAFISKPLFKSRMAHTFKSLLHHDSGATEELHSALDTVQQQDFTGKRAFLAEDNELNAEIAMEILQMTGLTVELARDGQEAFDMLSKAADGYYDIVFMDIQMPVMNGYEVTRAVRAIDRQYLKSVPILAMTANAFAEDVEAARDAGMNAHIAKPISVKQLSEALNKWLV